MEEKGISKYGMDREIQVTPEQLALVKSTIFPDSTDDELKLFCYECTRRGVHPLDRKIYPIKRKVGETEEKRVTFQTSIDFMRSESESTGTYAGVEEPVFGDVVDGKYPEWAKVTVYRWMIVPDGTYQRISFTGTARWKEYYPGEKLGFMWRKMPYHMLAKCAEAIARRLAWPQKLDKLYLPEEFVDTTEKITKNISDTVKSLTPDENKKAEKPDENAGQAPPGGLGRGKIGKTVNDTLKEEIEALTPDLEDRQRILTAVSSYVDETGKQKFIEYDKILKASNKWAGKALTNLRKQYPAKTKEPITFVKPDDCTNAPTTCDNSAWEQVEGGVMIAWCTDKKGRAQGECPFINTKKEQEGNGNG